MGLFDDDDLELDDLLESVKKFPPCVVDLNEGEVQAIFNRCLSNGGEETTYAQVLQKALSGKESDLVRFSQERINANSKNISYLLGQMKGVHKNEGLMLLEYGIVSYTGTKWTTNPAILFRLYDLGMVNINLTPFSLQEDGSLVTDISAITPTLSPKDPNFPAWWEAHKAEWEA